MANKSGEAPKSDLQALLARAKDMPIDITSMPDRKPSLAESLDSLELQVTQVMTVQLEKFEEIVAVVNSMKKGYNQIGSKVEKIQADLDVLQGKFAKDKVEKIQADQMVLQGKLEEVLSSLRKMEDCRQMEVDDDKGSEGNGLEEVHNEITSLKKGCELIGTNVSKIQADMAVLQGRLDNTKVNRIQADLQALTKRFDDATRSPQRIEDCPMHNAQDDQEEGSTDSGDEPETDSDCSTCTQSVVETATRYRIFDASGQLPFSLVFGLCRRSPADTDPRPLLLEIAASVLDVPFALAHGLLTLHEQHPEDAKQWAEAD
ncbi:hypothetical protein MMC31_004203 [Peltigera leucophlebia]|nr:hypothetical protein [Peltigera leucophlebia]